MIHIVTDGAVDMPAGWAEKYKIHVLPLMVRFGDRVYTSGVDISSQNFYSMVEQTRVIPKTSLPSPGQIAEFYRSIAKKGEKILSMHVSSKLSGTFSSVQLAARDVQDDFSVTVFDTQAGSVAMGFMCREARIMESAGYNIQAIMERLENLRKNITVIFTLDTLEFAHLSGRINVTQSFLGTFMKIKPIVLLRDGLLEIAEKVRTRSASLQRVIETVEQKIGNRPVHVAIVHASDPATAADMVNTVKQRFNCREVLVTELSIPVAANLGPGAIGIVAYVDNERW